MLQSWTFFWKFYRKAIERFLNHQRLLMMAKSWGNRGLAIFKCRYTADIGKETQ